MLAACKWLEIKQKFCWTLCAFFYILLRKTSYLVTNPFSGLFYITLKLRSIICMEIIHHCLNLVITFNLLLIILHLILLLDCTPLNIVQIVKLIYICDILLLNYKIDMNNFCLRLLKFQNKNKKINCFVFQISEFINHIFSLTNQFCVKIYRLIVSIGRTWTI